MAEFFTTLSMETMENGSALTELMVIFILRKNWIGMYFYLFFCIYLLFKTEFLLSNIFTNFFPFFQRGKRQLRNSSSYYK